MKTLTKLLATAAVLGLSATVFAHVSDNNSGFGPMHSMMGNGVNQPPQQMMQQQMQQNQDPQAMWAFMQSMHQNPQAMHEWMEKVHGQQFADNKLGFNCFGNRFGENQPSGDSQ